MEINADFSRRVVVHAARLPWVPSLMAGVERRMLDRIGDEVARATSIVRYAPGSCFSRHTHGGGEEFLVLEGVFQDEHGSYPSGSYVRNPPTSHHTPGSAAGCMLFVKLWQFDPADRKGVKCNTAEMTYAEAAANRPGVELLSLFRDDCEHVRLERWTPGAVINLSVPGGAELLVLDGSFDEGDESFKPLSWLRLPTGSVLQAKVGPKGCRVWIKTGHLLSSKFRTKAMNSNMPRLKPNPIPEIAPIPEHLAEPALKKIYEETKAALQVPWMGVVAMSFARYPRFYATLWGGFRELSASEEFLAACRELRQEAEAASLRAPSILQKLHDLGYTEPEIAEIRALIETFSHGNMPYVLIATAARLLLEGNEIGTSRSISRPVQSRHGPAAGGKLLLMEPHHAERQLQAVYEDLKSTLGLPFLNTDYRALARWPSYFDVAWRSLKPIIGSPAYDDAVGRVHNKAVALVLALPNPAALTSARLVAAADQDNAAESVLGVVRLFQWLLPGLVVNVAYMREQMLTR